MLEWSPQRRKATRASVLSFNDLCCFSIVLSGLARGKQRQANFINVLKFHSGVSLSPLCCVLELSEFPRSIYFWKKNYTWMYFETRSLNYPCLLIFLEGRLIGDGFGFFVFVVLFLCLHIPLGGEFQQWSLLWHSGSWHTSLSSGQLIQFTYEFRK